MSQTIATDGSTLIELIARPTVDAILASQPTVIELLPAMRGPKGDPGPMFDPANTEYETDFELAFKIHLEI